MLVPIDECSLREVHPVIIGIITHCANHMASIASTEYPYTSDLSSIVIHSTPYEVVQILGSQLSPHCSYEVLRTPQRRQKAHPVPTPITEAKVGSQASILS